MRCGTRIAIHKVNDGEKERWREKERERWREREMERERERDSLMKKKER